MSMPGYLYRSRDGLSNFEAGPRFFSDEMRHSALLIRDGLLYVFYSQRGDAPERILLSTIDFAGDWRNGQVSEPIEILRPLSAVVDLSEYTLGDATIGDLGDGRAVSQFHDIIQMPLARESIEKHWTNAQEVEGQIEANPGQTDIVRQLWVGVTSFVGEADHLQSDPRN